MAETLSWYHGCISTNEAIKICSNVDESGAFLLRDSQREQGAFTLSVLYKNGAESEVYHYRIKKTAENKLLLKVMQRDFTSWDKLVDYCKRQPRCEQFPQPLVRAIKKTMVDGWDKTDGEWQKSFKETKSKKRVVKVKDEAPSTKTKGYKNVPSPSRLTDFFRKPNKLFSSKEKAGGEKQDSEVIDDDEWSGDDFSENEDDDDTVPSGSCDAACGKEFIAKTDSSGQENEMHFKKGDKLLVEEVRSDGWCYCLNKGTKVHGWVHETCLEK